MSINIEENKKKFEKWCYAYIKSEKNKDSVKPFLEYLEKSDFYIAPASLSKHLSCEGGLCQHTMNVINRLFVEVNNSTNETVLPPETKEAIFMAAAFHDLCKIGKYKKVQQKKDNSETEYFIEVKDKLPLGHSEKSLFIAQKYFEIPENVAVAIRWHMGFSDSSFLGGNKSIGFAFKEYPLSLLLYIADLKATIMDEQ